MDAYIEVDQNTFLNIMNAFDPPVHKDTMDYRETRFWDPDGEVDDPEGFIVRIETAIYNRLEALCEDAGQTKTVAVERALTEYLDNYERKQQMLKELEEK